MTSVARDGIYFAHFWNCSLNVKIVWFQFHRKRHKSRVFVAHGIESFSFEYIYYFVRLRKFSANWTQKIRRKELNIHTRQVAMWYHITISKCYHKSKHFHFIYLYFIAKTLDWFIFAFGSLRCTHIWRFF